MTDSPTNPNEPRPHKDNEFEDHHYQDEEPEIAEDRPHEGRIPLKRKFSRRLPPPRRRFEED